MAGAIPIILQSLRKPLLFAIYGGLGSLVGALLGEGFVRVLRGASQEPATVAVPSPPGAQQVKNRQQDPSPQVPEDEDTIFGKMPISPERLRQIRNSIEKGDVEIGLVWRNHNDLDLHCIDPSGEEIYFYHKESRSRGTLDLDANAGVPYLDEPAEHIRWKEGEAPAGHYRVFVQFYANHMDGGGEPTKYYVSVKAPGLGGVKSDEGSLSRNERRLVYEFDARPGSTTQGKTAEDSPGKPPATGLLRFWSTGIVGVYTALIAVCLSLALVVGQNRYQHVSVLTVRQGMIVLLGGTVAGLIAGAVTQGLFSLMSAQSGGVLRESGRMAGWIVLGAILGRGMGLFIPNLPGLRALAAGGAGGILGAVALEFLGEWPGRIAGAAILGACIGLMIVLIEELAREAWLVVDWGPNEKVNISLGPQPVLIGSSSKAQVYLPRNRGYPEEWATISLNRGKILFEDNTTGRKQDLKNGSELKIDTITIHVRSAK